MEAKVNLKPVTNSKGVAKKQQLRLSATLFALAALLLLLPAVLFFDGKHLAFGLLFCCLAIMDGSLAFAFYRLSRRAGDGAV